MGEQPAALMGQLGSKREMRGDIGLFQDGNSKDTENTSDS